MGTHPIFESDFDCLTDTNNAFESGQQYTDGNCRRHPRKYIPWDDAFMSRDYRKIHVHPTGRAQPRKPRTPRLIPSPSSNSLSQKKSNDHAFVATVATIRPEIGSGLIGMRPSRFIMAPGRRFLQRARLLSGMLTFAR